MDMGAEKVLVALFPVDAVMGIFSGERKPGRNGA